MGWSAPLVLGRYSREVSRRLRPGDHGSVTLNVKQQFGEIVDKI